VNAVRVRAFMVEVATYCIGLSIMNKTHWNTVEIDGTINDNIIEMLIDISYDLVFKGLRKKEREEINKKRTY
jgi:hypothetical protein